MSLNIKNEHVHALAREAARLTGKSQTSVIEEALERMLTELRRSAESESRRHRLDALFADIQATVTPEDSAALRRAAEELFDDSGLPA